MVLVFKFVAEPSIDEPHKLKFADGRRSLKFSTKGRLSLGKGGGLFYVESSARKEWQKNLAEEEFSPREGEESVLGECGTSGKSGATELC